LRSIINKQNCSACREGQSPLILPLYRHDHRISTARCEESRVSRYSRSTNLRPPDAFKLLLKIIRRSIPLDRANGGYAFPEQSEARSSMQTASAASAADIYPGRLNFLGSPQSQALIRPLARPARVPRGFAVVPCPEEAAMASCAGRGMILTREKAK
jgi:hypothetical protein